MQAYEYSESWYKNLEFSLDLIQSDPDWKIDEKREGSFSFSRNFCENGKQSKSTYDPTKDCGLYFFFVWYLDEKEWYQQDVLNSHENG